ncbi:PhzF family phenazine biosynthesis protein [Alkaliphilus hydrothermalis]|uniref:PhzF family phenazine biosynthesis protein n=1 Tax=Alkaliphilus hydrothermalis TaxID=1482730 RepID=A0ABS2NST4_9FIRM|nr:PhzF family phenazine biosynthesis protein [Alkaliphilus hydrothermalis]MBM7615891.1 PhzF family phenazine biosynthesis protein [Alkaliphilus hydrothermalis]
MKEIYRLRAFAKTEEGGNPAGVVLEADALSEEEMRLIAAEVGYSETAFVMKSNQADFRVRFFTPVEEVDLCGHATIATFNLLRELGIVQKGEYTQETKAGVLKLRISEEDVFMEQNRPHYGEIISVEEIKDCFSCDTDYIDTNFPIQVVSTGLPDIILAVKDIKTLHQLQPDHQAISDISEKYGVVGIHAFTLETLHSSTSHCRNFAPLYGIDEESATGTASGALACYLMKYVEGISQKMVFEQGYSMNQPSEIKVELTGSQDEINSVFVGGKAIRI